MSDTEVEIVARALCSSGTRCLNGLHRHAPCLDEMGANAPCCATTVQLMLSCFWDQARAAVKVLDEHRAVPIVGEAE